MIAKINRNFIRIISFIVVAALLIFAWNWISTDTGKAVFKSFVDNLPFVNFIYSIVTKVAGNAAGIKDITVSSTLFDFSKMLCTTFFKGLFTAGLLLLVSCLSKFETMYRMGADAATGGILRSIFIDALEEKMASPFYKIGSGIAKIVAVTVAAIVSNAICNQLKSLIDGTQGMASGLVALIIFLFFYISYSLIFSYAAGKTIEFGLIKTFLVNIIPEILSVFITNVIYVIIYVTLVRCGVGFYFILSLLALLLWSLVEDFIKRFFQLMAAKLGLRSSASAQGMSAMQVLLWIIHSISCMCLIYGMALIADFASAYPEYFGTLPFYAILTGTKLLPESAGEVTLDFFALVLHLAIVCMFFSAVNKKPLVKNCILWLFLIFPITEVFTLLVSGGVGYLLSPVRYETWFGVLLILVICVMFFDVALLLNTIATVVMLLGIGYQLQLAGTAYQPATIFEEHPMAICMIALLEIWCAVAYKLREK